MMDIKSHNFMIDTNIHHYGYNKNTATANEHPKYN